MMTMKKIVLILLVYLQGCSDVTEGFFDLTSDDVLINKKLVIPELQFTYPNDRQQEVVPSTPIILRFTSAPDFDDISEQFHVCINDTVKVDRDNFIFTLTEDKKSIYIESRNRFETGSSVKVYWEDNDLNCNDDVEGLSQFSFKIRSDNKGLVKKSNNINKLVIENIFPDSDNDITIPFDFSSFRFTFNHHIDPTSIQYGKTVKLLDDNGSLVPAKVYVSNNKMTLDPCNIPDGEYPYDCGSQADRLLAGKDYLIEIDGIHSKSLSEDGQVMMISNYQKPIINIQSSGLTDRIVMTLADGGQPSLLSGQAVNSVQINSILLGQSEVSQADGQLIAELADVTQFSGDQAIPIRVARGSDLIASALPIKLGGYIPVINQDTGEEKTTGDIIIRLLNDANGYLMPNPYSDDINANRHVKLILDLVLMVREPSTNAVATQNLLGVELTGLADINDGRLRLSAFSMLEPILLGQDTSFSSLSLNLVSETGDNSDLIESADNERQNRPAPSVISWSPGESKSRNGNAANLTHKMMRRGDPALFSFDQPVDALDEDKALVSIIANDVENIPPEAINTRIDGSLLVIDLIDGFVPGSKYEITLTDNIINTEGRSVNSETFEFVLEKSSQKYSGVQVSPILTTTYPGFNCASSVQLADVFSDTPTHGHCYQAEKSSAPNKVLPLSTLPSNRVIKLVFSQPMDVDSIQLNQSLIVEKVLNIKGDVEVVPGRIRKSHHLFEFVPQQLWDVGAIYRYTLKSATADTRNQANRLCDNKDIICSDVGYPLQTDLLVNSEDIGGPDLVIYFRAVEPLTTSLTQLRNYPVRDVNANYHIDEKGCHKDRVPLTRSNPEGVVPIQAGDCLEPFVGFNHAERGLLVSENSTLVQVDGDILFTGGPIKFPVPLTGRIGCLPEDPNDCPNNKYLYQIYALNIEMMDPSQPGTIVTDPETGKEGVRVFLYPTMLATTSFTVYIDIDVPIVENVLRLFGIEILDSASGPQVLRMPYFPVTEENPLGLIPGIVMTGDDGQAIFKTELVLDLDIPNLHIDIPLIGSFIRHNLYSYPLKYNLAGDITMYDDGRIQIEQWNSNSPDINARLGLFDLFGSGIDIGIQVPLKIPVNGQFLNFVSMVSKDIRKEN